LTRVNRPPETLLIDASSQRPAGTPAVVRPLNAMDCGMLACDRVLRSIGQPDFETQTLVWLASRADRDRVETGIRRLARKYPVIAARLDESSLAEPFWRVPAEPEVRLLEAALPAATSDAVHDYAARQLALRHDAGRTDPMRFHLLHLPDGRDVFLVQYTHVLMDNSAAIGLLRDIDTPRDANGGDDAGPRLDEQDVLDGYLGRFSAAERTRAVLRVLDLRFRSFRGRPVTLGEPRATRGAQGPVKFPMKSARLEADAVRRLAARSTEICGFPSLSMALLAGAFRALGRETRQPRSLRRNFIAGLGVDLGLRGRDGPLFRNLMSIVPLRARWSELEDYDELVRMLSQQFRQRLNRSADLGLVMLARFVSRRPRLGDRAVRRVMLGGYSLWYAYFGALDGVGETFCGARIEDVYFTAPTWPPMGLTLLASQFRGRLHLQATYLPEIVPDDTMQRYLEGLVADLTGE
jgi:hypothetical protein